MYLYSDCAKCFLIQDKKFVASAKGLVGSSISYGVTVSSTDREELKLFLQNDARELSKSDILT